ncbi:MAG TPA: hypothetical protein VI386_29510 [Candidatus Sulfotelmatobacter sp.]
MKRAAALITFLCLPAVLFAQMTPQYSAYAALSVNASTNTGYSTVTVQGTTNPYSQNCYYKCESGICQIPNCPSTHTPKILNQYGTIGGLQTGPGYQPNAVINYSTTIAVPLDPVHGSQTRGTQTAEVDCNGCGCAIITFTWSFEFAFTGVVWPGVPTPACVTLLGITSCNYSVANNCTVATSPPDNNFTGASVTVGDYRGIATKLYWTTAAPCERTVVNGTAGPWSCAPTFLIWLTGLNVVMPPYSCTHNP